MAEEQKPAGNGEEKAAEGKTGETTGEDFETLAEKYSSELKYLAAEFDNYKKRAARERREASQSAAEKIVAEMLPVLDDFDATVKALKEHCGDAEAVDGVEMLHKKFVKALEAKGLKRIETAGRKFDVDAHEAAGFEDSEDAEEGTIMREVQAGYVVGNTVVRHAKVIVARKKQGEKTAEEKVDASK